MYIESKKKKQVKASIYPQYMHPQPDINKIVSIRVDRKDSVRIVTQKNAQMRGKYKGERETEGQIT